MASTKQMHLCGTVFDYRYSAVGRMVVLTDRIYAIRVDEWEIVGPVVEPTC